MRSFTRWGLGAVTAASMAITTFPIIVVSVLAAQLIDEFGISRAQIGLLAMANGVTGALASPLFGRITDRLGAVASITWTFLAGAVALSVFASSPSYGLLVMAAFISGIPNAWGNPATNALIVDNVPAGSRGVVTGIKQSGVQVGTFLGGLLLPIFTGWWSWRQAVLVFLAIPAAGLLSMIGRRDPDRPHRRRPRSTAKLPVAVRWISGYGFVSGLATSAMIAFLPLFANEDLGWSESAAGALIALAGLTGIGARMFWPRLSERSMGHRRTLRLLASLTMVTAVLLTLAALGVVGAWVLPPAVLFLGGGAIAWNSVGMLAVMDLSPEGSVGKGTGVVLLGFLLGLALGPPLMGASVDAWGTYAPGWMATAALLAISTLITTRLPSGVTLADS